MKQSRAGNCLLQLAITSLSTKAWMLPCTRKLELGLWSCAKTYRGWVWILRSVYQLCQGRMRLGLEKASLVIWLIQKEVRRNNRNMMFSFDLYSKSPSLGRGSSRRLYGGGRRRGLLRTHAPINLRITTKRGHRRQSGIYPPKNHWELYHQVGESCQMS